MPIMATFAVLFASVYVESASAIAPDETILEAEQAEAARIAMIERAAPAVVSIFDEHERGGGSGVLIDDDGHGLTNYHVVAVMLDSRKGLGGLNDGKLYDLQVLGIDPGGDVAMFRLSGRERFPHATLGDSDCVGVGDTVIAMGNPFVLADDFTPTVTMGVVSGIHRYQWGTGDSLLYSDCIQVDASINPGNSGGPLFNGDGQVIGINGRISVSMRGRVNVGIGYAITSNQIKAFMPELRAGLIARHGTLEAVVRDRPDGSVIFAELLENGPAWRIGIRPGDLLVSIDGRRIESANHFASVLGTMPDEWPVALAYQRNDGIIVNRQARTDSVPVDMEKEFEPDPQNELPAIRRLLERFRTAVGADPAREPGASRWRWIETHVGATQPPETSAYRLDDTGTGSIDLTALTAGRPSIRITADAAEAVRSAGRQPLTTDLNLLYRSLFHLHRSLLAPVDPCAAPDLRYGGAGRLLTIEGDGTVTSRLLECIIMSLEPSAEARYEFDAESAVLRRVIVADRPTGDSAVLTFSAGLPWPQSAELSCRSGDSTVTYSDVHAPGRAEREPQVTAVKPEDGPPPVNRNTAHPAIERISSRVVKLVGAQVGRNPGYGSGILVSPEGLILTVDSGLLDSRNVRAVFHDGSTHILDVVHSDRDLQLALLCVRPAVPQDTNGNDGSAGQAAPAPFDCFNLSDQAPLVRGQWVLAAGNPFKIASGSEPTSISRGVYSGRIKLDASRGAQDFPYRGDVLVIDAITSTPGFPGGALVDLDGRLVGLLGRVVESRATHTMLNHALPIEVLRSFVAEALNQETLAGGHTPPADQLPQAVYHGMKFFELGYRTNPVYVDRVRRGSPAALAGVRKDDLIVGANGKPIPKLDVLERIIADCRPGDTLELTLLREGEIRMVSLKLEAAP